MRSLLLLVVAFGLLHGVLASGETGPSQYEDTPAGLRQLLTDSIEVARNHENDKLSQIVDGMRIPDYAQWFADTEYHSESWAEAYGRQVASPQFGASLKSRLHEFSDRDGDVVTVRINDGPNTPHGLEDAWVSNLKRPVNIYRADWMDRVAEGRSRPDQIGYFVYVDGAFRWYSIIRQFVFNLPRGWLLRRGGMPKYPYPGDGRHASGYVHLKFVIRDDGFVDKVKPVPAVDSTKDRAIIESAVKAVRQWNLMRIPGSEPGSTNVDDFRISVAPEEAY
jgi:hypothetical protein